MKTETNPLKRRRLSLGYSQKQMSELIEITQSQYSRIENGSSGPTKYLKKYLMFLNVILMKFSKEEFLRRLRMNFSKFPLKRWCVLIMRKNLIRCMWNSRGGLLKRSWVVSWSLQLMEWKVRISEIPELNEEFHLTKNGRKTPND